MVYCAPDTKCFSFTGSPLNLKTTLGSKYSSVRPPFSDEETEAQRGPRRLCDWVTELRLGLRLCLQKTPASLVEGVWKLGGQRGIQQECWPEELMFQGHSFSGTA